MRNLEHLYQTRNVQELLNGHESPFTVSEPKVDQDHVSVTVNHPTQSGEPLSMTGVGKRTNGETNEELLFDALRDGLGTPEVQSVEYLGHFEDPQTHKVELRVLGTSGDVFSAKADTFLDAATNTFAAFSLQES